MLVQPAVGRVHPAAARGASCRGAAHHTVCDGLPADRARGSRAGVLPLPLRPLGQPRQNAAAAAAPGAVRRRPNLPFCAAGSRQPARLDAVGAAAVEREVHRRLQWTSVLLFLPCRRFERALWCLRQGQPLSAFISLHSVSAGVRARAGWQGTSAPPSPALFRHASISGDRYSSAWLSVSIIRKRTNFEISVRAQNPKCVLEDLLSTVDICYDAGRSAVQDRDEAAGCSNSHCRSDLYRPHPHCARRTGDSWLWLRVSGGAA